MYCYKRRSLAYSLHNIRNSSVLCSHINLQPAMFTMMYTSLTALTAQANMSQQEVLHCVHAPTKNTPKQKLNDLCC